MLCPDCGSNVGDELKRCDGCEERAVQRALERQREIDALNPKARRKIERSASPELINDDSDPELQLMAFFASPIGIALISLTVFMISLVVMVVAVPGHGVIGSTLLTLMISGVAIAAAGPYAFGFSSTAKRYMARAFGAGLTLLGGFLYSTYTGKSLGESYAIVSDILYVEESGSIDAAYTDDSAADENSEEDDYEEE